MLEEAALLPGELRNEDRAVQVVRPRDLRYDPGIGELLIAGQIIVEQPAGLSGLTE